MVISYFFNFIKISELLGKIIFIEIDDEMGCKLYCEVNVMDVE